MAIHVVRDGKGRPPASRYLAEQHPRFRRLLDVLSNEGVIERNAKAWELTRATKALVF